MPRSCNTPTDHVIGQGTNHWHRKLVQRFAKPFSLTALLVFILALGALASPCEAQISTYSVSATFATGDTTEEPPLGTVSGTFTVDFSVGSVLYANISTTANPKFNPTRNPAGFPATTYTAAGALAFLTYPALAQVDLVASDSTTDNGQVSLVIYFNAVNHSLSFVQEIAGFNLSKLLMRTTSRGVLDLASLTLHVTANGTILGPIQCTSISSGNPPKLPQISATLTGVQNIEVLWRLSVTYTGPGTSPVTYTDVFSTSLGISQPWVIDWGSHMIGGTATLAWTAAGQSGQFLFCINGNNANPDAATLLFQLGTNPWYLFQIAEQESPNGSLPGALQFNMITKSKADTAYQPVWGSPNGFGIMQIDPPLSELDVFSWTHNVADGVLLAQQQNGAAVTFWNRQVAQYKTWLQANPRTAPPPPTPDPESNCGEFVYGIPKAGQHSFSDAIGIKKYNGLGNNSLSDVNGYNYIVWQNTGAFQLKPHWTIFPYTVVQLSSGPQDIYYVSNVCSRSKTP